MDGKTRLLIISSLVVNLFLAGALIGVLVVGARMMRDHDEDRRGGGDRGVWTAFQSIPPERRQALGRTMRAPVTEAIPDLRAAREARRRAAALIAAPAYDAAAVETAFKEARELDGRARAKIDAAMAKRLAELSPQERAIFGQVMLRGPRGGFGGDRGGERGRGRGDDRDGDRGGPPDGPPPPR